MTVLTDMQVETLYINNSTEHHTRSSVIFMASSGRNFAGIYDQKKSLNGTLAVDSPFQTLAVDFSLNL